MDLRLLAVSCFKKYGLLTQMSVVFSISSSFIGLLLFACRLSLTEIYFDFPVTYSTLWVPICSFKSCRKPTFAERNRSALKAKDISIQKTCPCKASTERTYGSFYLKKNIYKHLIIFFFLTNYGKIKQIPFSPVFLIRKSSNISHQILWVPECSPSEFTFR